MARSLKFRRRREGKTNYHKRLKLLQSGKPRLVIRRSNTGVYCQIISYEPAGDRVLASASSKDLRKVGATSFSAKSLPGSYLIGFTAAVRARKAGVEEAIVDFGMFSATKGNRLFAAVKGAIDGGLTIPVNDDVLPPAERLAGKHIEAHRNVTINLEQLKAKLRT